MDLQFLSICHGNNLHIIFMGFFWCHLYFGCLFLICNLCSIPRGNPLDQLGASEHLIPRKKIPGMILHAKNLQKLQDKRALCYPFFFIIHNSKPVGHQVILFLIDDSRSTMSRY